MLEQENWGPLKKHKRKVKTRMEISIRNSDKKKPSKTTESDKTKEKH